ncbi:hypothetical protein ACLHK8_01370 [Pediococcus sp. M21F004]|uniref:hypothetical protein n=1 Tax=Pediococcus sp. M21F004 TaxID=3390033 RepID=UPI003DA743C0
METRFANYFNPQLGSHQSKIEIPGLCPFCSVGNNPTFRLECKQTYTDGKHVAMIACTCPSCGGWSYVLIKKESSNSSSWKLLSSYPQNSKHKFDKLIKDVSPKFIELYNSASNAEQNGFFDLAGMGYRGALEVLIKDWALAYSDPHESKEKIARYKLNDAIAHFFKNDVAAFNSSDVVREFGNDFTHWNRPDDFDARQNLDEVKIYLNILINSVYLQLKIANPPAGRGHHSVSKSK